MAFPFDPSRQPREEQPGPAEPRLPWAMQEHFDLMSQAAASSIGTDDVPVSKITRVLPVPPVSPAMEHDFLKSLNRHLYEHETKTNAERQHVRVVAPARDADLRPMGTGATARVLQQREIAARQQQLQQQQPVVSFQVADPLPPINRAALSSFRRLAADAVSTLDNLQHDELLRQQQLLWTQQRDLTVADEDLDGASDGGRPQAEYDDMEYDRTSHAATDAAMAVPELHSLCQ
jgi:hypothetical protein